MALPHESITSNKLSHGNISISLFGDEIDKNLIVSKGPEVKHTNNFTKIMNGIFQMGKQMEQKYSKKSITAEKTNKTEVKAQSRSSLKQKENKPLKVDAQINTSQKYLCQSNNRSPSFVQIQPQNYYQNSPSISPMPQFYSHSLSAPKTIINNFHHYHYYHDPSFEHRSNSMMNKKKSFQPERPAQIISNFLPNRAKKIQQQSQPRLLIKKKSPTCLEGLVQNTHYVSPYSFGHQKKQLMIFNNDLVNQKQCYGQGQLRKSGKSPASTAESFFKKSGDFENNTQKAKDSIKVAEIHKDILRNIINSNKNQNQTVLKSQEQKKSQPKEDLKERKNEKFSNQISSLNNFMKQLIAKTQNKAQQKPIQIERNVFNFARKIDKKKSLQQIIEYSETQSLRQDEEQKQRASSNKIESVKTLKNQLNLSALDKLNNLQENLSFQKSSSNKVTQKQIIPQKQEQNQSEKQNAQFISNLMQKLQQLDNQMSPN